MPMSSSTSTLINNTHLSNGAAGKQNMTALPLNNNNKLSPSPQPSSSASNSNLIQKQHNNNDNTPTFKIKTSKKWVLPPRPKPGRKPSQANPKEKSANAQSNSCPRKRTTKKQPIINQSASATSSSRPSVVAGAITMPSKNSSSPSPTLAPTPNNNNNNNSSNLQSINVIDRELEESILKNPIKQEILKINEENYYLKLQVIKLVSDLKSLKSEITKQSPNSHAPLIAKEKSLPKPASPMDLLTDNGKITCMPLSQPAAIPMSRKRSHDEDINDLIVSLLDLSHTTPSPESTSTTTEVPLQQQQPRKLLALPTTKHLPTPKTTPHPISIKSETCQLDDETNYLKSSPTINEDDFLNLSGTDDIDDDELFDELINNSHHNGGAEEETGTPNTMLSLIKTNETIESLSGSTLVSTSLAGSPRFKLIDIPNSSSTAGEMFDQDKEFSIFDNVPSSVFSGAGKAMGKYGSSLSIVGGGSSGVVNDDVYYSDYYDFSNGGGLNDVEMEFENFINGGTGNTTSI